jgi:hypothetical protein
MGYFLACKALPLPNIVQLCTLFSLQKIKQNSLQGAR